MHGSSGRRPKVLAITNDNPAWPEADRQHADDGWQALLTALEQQGFTFRGVKFFDDLTFLDDVDRHEWLVWNWGEELAGRPWSDAEVVEEIERRGLAYTGGSPALIRLAQDRMGVKRHLQSAGIPTLPAVVLRRPDEAADWTTFPAIVKGANQHGSIGIDSHSVVFTTEELARRVAHVRNAHGDDALVEPFLDTREFQVPVWGNDSPEALPPAELVYSAFTEMRDRLYTEAWKTDPTSLGYRRIEMPCPAPLDRPDWRARLERVAVGAYRALGLRDYARFDMRMRGDEPQVLDVNVNPDLMNDGRSVFVVAAKARGIDYAQMVATIIELASARMPLS